MALTCAQQKGMTLLEVLVAMTLMVIISAIAYASLNGLIDAKLHTDAVALDLRQELLTSQQLNKDIHAIINRSSKDQIGTKRPAIIGQYSSIQFSRNGHLNPLNQHRSDLQQVHWFVRDNQLFRRTLDMLDSGSFPTWLERKYMDDVDRLNINYINSVGQESRRWPIENSILPLKLISFSIELTNKTSLNYLLRPGQ